MGQQDFKQESEVGSVKKMLSKLKKMSEEKVADRMAVGIAKRFYGKVWRKKMEKKKDKEGLELLDKIMKDIEDMQTKNPTKRNKALKSYTEHNKEFHIHVEMMKYKMKLKGKP